MEELIRILEEVRPDLDFDKEKTLIDSGVLDSFDIITMVGEINDTFGIEINVADLLPENFNSKETIWVLRLNRNAPWHKFYRFFSEVRVKTKGLNVN